MRFYVPTLRFRHLQIKLSSWFYFNRWILLISFRWTRVLSSRTGFYLWKLSRPLPLVDKLRGCFNRFRASGSEIVFTPGISLAQITAPSAYLPMIKITKVFFPFEPNVLEIMVHQLATIFNLLRFKHLCVYSLTFDDWIIRVVWTKILLFIFCTGCLGIFLLPIPWFDFLLFIFQCVLLLLCVVFVLCSWIN